MGSVGTTPSSGRTFERISGVRPELPRRRWWDREEVSWVDDVAVTNTPGDRQSGRRSGSRRVPRTTLSDSTWIHQTPFTRHLFPSTPVTRGSGVDHPVWYHPRTLYGLVVSPRGSSRV